MEVQEALGGCEALGVRFFWGKWGGGGVGAWFCLVAGGVLSLGNVGYVDRNVERPYFSIPYMHVISLDGRALLE